MYVRARSAYLPISPLLRPCPSFPFCALRSQAAPWRSLGSRPDRWNLQRIYVRFQLGDLGGEWDEGTGEDDEEVEETKRACARLDRSKDTPSDIDFAFALSFLSLLEDALEEREVGRPPRRSQVRSASSASPSSPSSRSFPCTAAAVNASEFHSFLPRDRAKG